MTPLRFSVIPVCSVALALALSGCTHERPVDIPPQATMTAEGDNVLTYVAPQDGRVYVHDTDHDRMLYAGDLEKGQAIVVDPHEDHITVDGRTVLDRGMTLSDRRRIFFEAAEPPDNVIVPSGTKIEVKDEPKTRIEIQDQDDADTTVRIKEADPDTTVRVKEGSDTEIEVKEDSGTRIEVKD